MPTTPVPHPAIETNRHPTLIRYIWRFATGHHLDGRARTNATWTKRGTSPAHHMNWWNAKSRFNRMWWRWGMIFVPASLVTAYVFAPYVRINLSLFFMMAMAPYVLHHVVMYFHSKLPHRTVVYVTNDVVLEDVDSEYDNVAIPEQMEVMTSDDDIQGLFDREVGLIDENDRANSPRKNRRP